MACTRAIAFWEGDTAAITNILLKGLPLEQSVNMGARTPAAQPDGVIAAGSCLQEHLGSAVTAALDYLFRPEAVAVPAPPAPFPVTSEYTCTLLRSTMD
jgi:hypothetical protein